MLSQNSISCCHCQRLSAWLRCTAGLTQEGISYAPVLQGASHRDSTVTLHADVFPIRYSFLINSRLPNIIRSGLTTSLNICYYWPPSPKKVSFFVLNLHFQLAAIKTLFICFLVWSFRTHLLNIFKLFCIIRVAKDTSTDFQTKLRFSESLLLSLRAAVKGANVKKTAAKSWEIAILLWLNKTGYQPSR